jgi:hypothetical protein
MSWSRYCSTFLSGQQIPISRTSKFMMKQIRYEKPEAKKIKNKTENKNNFFKFFEECIQSNFSECIS